MKRNISIKWFETIDSTNNEAIRHIEAYDNLTVIAAAYQTAGKGQRGNGWSSEPWKNLLFSIILEFHDFPAERQFAISQKTALGVCDYLDRHGLDARIKWPNDIYIGDRKICGILIENGVRSGLIRRSVVGIGFNLNQKSWDPSVPNPTSLLNECPPAEDGQEYGLGNELGQLAVDIAARVTQEGDDDATAEEYLWKMYRLGETHQYEDLTEGKRFYGKIIGTTTKGTLLVEKAGEGTIKEFAFKEIAYIIG